MPKRLLIVVGDPSADRHAERLVSALKQKQPDIHITAFGGEHLRRVADQFEYPLVGVGGFGFLEPILKIPQLWKIRGRIDRILKSSSKPDAVILMDYYGFNIHIASLAKRLSMPVFYYISPQVWASRPGRIQKLAATVTRMLVIFPFEEKLYREHGIPVRYVGHPLLEQMPEPGAAADPQTVGLLPGSRQGTVERHLPLMVGAADLLHSDFPNVCFILFRAAELPAVIFAPFQATRPWLKVIMESNFEERRRLAVALSVSGTAALENTLLGIPMVIMYRLSTVTYWIARLLIKVPFVGIPNLLAGREIVPERLQGDATPARLAEAMRGFLNDPARRLATRAALLSLRQQLLGGASENAADEILRSLSTS